MSETKILFLHRDAMHEQQQQQINGQSRESSSHSSDSYVVPEMGPWMDCGRGTDGTTHSSRLRIHAKGMCRGT